MSLTCSQCGRAAPADPAELERWRNAELVGTGEGDEIAATMLLCPDCVEEQSSERYDTGEPG